MSLCLSGQITTDLQVALHSNMLLPIHDGTLTYNVDFSYSNDTSWEGGGTTSFGYYKKTHSRHHLINSR